MVGREHTACASTASSLKLRRANAWPPLTHVSMQTICNGDTLKPATCLYPVSQALCPKPPFLPRTDDPQASLANTSPEAALLDRQFRLLREDMVGPLREELQKLGILQRHQQQQQGLGATPDVFNHSLALRSSSSSSSDQSQQSSWVHSAAAAASPNVFRNVRVLGIELKPRPCVMVAVTLPKGHRANQFKSEKERLEFWSAYGHGTLPADALVCLVSASSEAAARGDVSDSADDEPQAAKQQLAFATVVRRDVKELAWEHGPVVGLAFAPRADVEKILSHMGSGVLQDTVLVQVGSAGGHNGQGVCL